MKLFHCLLFAAVLLLPQATLSQAASIEDKVYEWLVNQQNSRTGLLGNQEDDDFSGIYPNSLAAMCYIYKGDVERAREIFSFYHSRLRREFASGAPQGYRQYWNASTGEVFAHTDRWIGDNAWLLMALNYYRLQTGDGEFDNMSRKIAQWLISLQDRDGGILAGFNEKGAMTHKSTEGNLDSFAALIHYPRERKKIKRFLTSKMWVEEDQRLKMGSTVSDSSFDCISWGICALGKSAGISASYGERRFSRVKVSGANGKRIMGFSDFLDKERIWLEGTGQMVVAYNTIGAEDKAQEYLNELEKAMVPSERFIGTLGIPCFTNKPSWEGGEKKIFVPSQAWYLFGKWKFNPMDSSQYDLSHEIVMTQVPTTQPSAQ